MAPRVTLHIQVGTETRRVLEGWVRAPTTPQRLAFRSRIVLAGAHGTSTAAIARDLDTTRPTVRLWLRRFQERGPAGLLTDAPGRGRPRALSTETESAIRALRPTSQGAASAADVARRFGASPSTVRRLWRRDLPG